MTKYINIILLILLGTQTIEAQIPDFSKNQPEIKPIPFEGDKFWFSRMESENVLAGIVGEKVYYRENVCEVSDFLRSNDFLKNHKIVLNCEKSGKKKLKKSEFNEIVFLKSINNTTNFIEDKIYIYKGEKFENFDLNGSHLVIKDNEEFHFTKAFYCKVREHKYSICIERDNGQVFEIDTHNGQIPNQGRVALKGIDYESFCLATDKSSCAKGTPDLEDEGESLGDFDDSGDGIFGRKVIYREHYWLAATSKSGKIVFKVCVDREGNVTHVELNEFETTIDERDVIRKAMQAMWKYKYEPDPKAARVQCGRYFVIIDNYRGIR